jgi:hypothetical protein
MISSTRFSVSPKNSMWRSTAPAAPRRDHDAGEVR